MTFYDRNIYGQIYNLKEPEHHVVDASKINELIRRMKNRDYNYLTAKVVDGYIYTYLMSPEQQAMCGRKPELHASDKLITASDDYAEAITKMCETVYDEEFCKHPGGKEAERGRLLKYCGDYLSQLPWNVSADK